jgi:hypothetical protein
VNDAPSTAIPEQTMCSSLCIRRILIGSSIILATACDDALAPRPAFVIERGPGTGQVGYAGSKLYQSLQVRVVDVAVDRGVPGKTVFWTVIEGNGAPSVQKTVTDAAGMTAVEWTLGPEPGTNRVVASIDSTARVTFHAIGVPAPDCTNGCWAFRRPLPTARSSLAAAVEGGGIYAVGGDGPRAYCRGESVVEKYDIATDTWTQAPPMPTGRSSLGVAVLNGRLYALGGCRLLRSTGVAEEYDPALDRWRTLTPMQSPRAGLAAATLGDRLFAAGGLKDGRWIVPDVESFDPSTNTWRFHASLPTPRSGLALVAVNGKLFAIGGYWDAFELTTVEMYDPALDQWFERASMKLGGGPVAAVVLDGRIYTMASWLNDAVVEVYDPLRDTWDRAFDLVTPRVEAAAVSVADCLYLIGGIDLLSGLPVSDLDVYSPRDGCRSMTGRSVRH